MYHATITNISIIKCLFSVADSAASLLIFVVTLRVKLPLSGQGFALVCSH